MPHEQSRRSGCKLLYLAVVFLTAIVAVAAPSRKLHPVDEAPEDRTFHAFRRALLQAMRQRNHQALASHLDPKIRLDFGGGSGISSFRRRWKPEQRNSRIWTELNAILSHGGSFQGEGKDRMFWAPYVFSDFPEDGDAFSEVCVLGKNVRARSRPSLQAPVLSLLTYDILRAESHQPIREKTPDGTRLWMKVRTPDGKIAYVAQRWVRSPIDYRAGFEKRGGQWKMVALVAGD